MKTEIYYFSGTGNSLAVARNIAEKTDGKLVAIPSVMDQETIESGADVIGIVFPVFYATNDCGIPQIIRRFAGKLEKIGSKYIFAVCTSGYMPGETLGNLESLIQSRGGRLAAGFVVNMSSKLLSAELRQKMQWSFREKLDSGLTEKVSRKNKGEELRRKRFDEKLEIICKTINARKTSKLETRGIMGKIIFAPLLLLIKPVFKLRYEKLANASRLPFDKLILLADRSFQSNEKCNGCGICARVCPVKNIEIVAKTPVWQHHCETCYGCYQWCPQEAIYGEIVKYNEKYHHPNVELSDMLR